MVCQAPSPPAPLPPSTVGEGSEVLSFFRELIVSPLCVDTKWWRGMAGLERTRETPDFERRPGLQAYLPATGN
jgi:hypothetical protein